MSASRFLVKTQLQVSCNPHRCAHDRSGAVHARALSAEIGDEIGNGCIEGWQRACMPVSNRRMRKVSVRGFYSVLLLLCVKVFLDFRRNCCAGLSTQWMAHNLQRSHGCSFHAFVSLFTLPASIDLVSTFRAFRGISKPFLGESGHTIDSTAGG